jgi:hypothetical protein
VVVEEVKGVKYGPKLAGPGMYKNDEKTGVYSTY